MPHRITRVLAVDPGYDRAGVAVLTRSPRERVIYSACLSSTRGKPFEERLGEIGAEIERLIKTHRPEALALERLYFNTNQKTALAVAEVRGMLRYLAVRGGLSFFEYTPAEVKQAVTGNGRSDKRQVAAMVERLVALPRARRLDDEYDAIAIGLTCLSATRGLR